MELPVGIGDLEQTWSQICHKQICRTRSPRVGSGCHSIETCFKGQAPGLGCGDRAQALAQCPQNLVPPDPWAKAWARCLLVRVLGSGQVHHDSELGKAPPSETPPSRCPLEGQPQLLPVGTLRGHSRSSPTLGELSWGKRAAVSHQVLPPPPPFPACTLRAWQAVRAGAGLTMQWAAPGSRQQSVLCFQPSRPGLCRNPGPWGFRGGPPSPLLPSETSSRFLQPVDALLREPGPGAALQPSSRFHTPPFKFKDVFIFI